MTTNAKNDAARAVRLRLRDDFPFYAKNALKIRTKAAQVVPFNLNEAQKRLEEVIEEQMRTTGMVRVAILKARQQGLSTFVGGWLYFRVSQAQAKKAIVVTHKADSTNALFNMTKRFHEHVPAILKPSTSYSSKKELVFDKLDSSYMVATAGGEGIARGETITHAHLSELAFWKDSTAQENLNGLLQSIPDAPDTAIFVESTANGVTGPFYDLWQGAVAGENGYYPLFIPWFIDPDYRKTAPEGFERTPEEDTLAETYGLDNDQLYWRRTKIAQNGADLFKQEYPATPDEAFLTTGRPVFDPVQLTNRKAQLEGPSYRMALELEKWRRHPVGELSVYREIDPGGTYYIGADVAMGLKGGDYSVAQVLDEKKRQVAVWRGHVHPDYFAEVLNFLGKAYNNARIAVESNNHGLLTVNMLYKFWHYPNVFTHVSEDKVTDLDTPQLGFRTDAKTRPLIIDDLRASMRNGEIELNDSATITEMLTFVVRESGRIEADQGCHDDCVMSLAIANHIHDGVWAPIQITDSLYIESI